MHEYLLWVAKALGNFERPEGSLRCSQYLDALSTDSRREGLWPSIPGVHVLFRTHQVEPDWVAVGSCNPAIFHYIIGTNGTRCEYSAYLQATST